MILVHDLVEAEAGDVRFSDDSGRRAQKPARERAAIESIRARLGPPLGQEIYELWREFEDKTSAEARRATALDNLEVQIQHNLAPLETWTPIEHHLIYTNIWTSPAPTNRSSTSYARRSRTRPRPSYAPPAATSTRSGSAAALAAR